MMRSFIVKLEDEEFKRRNEVEEIKRSLENLQTDIPENIADIMYLLFLFSYSLIFNTLTMY